MEEPDDRYVRLLAGKKLEDGKGFPGVVVLGDQLGKAMDLLRNGREDFTWPFWYFYDKGPWQLTICTNFMYRMTRGGTTVHAIIIGGDGAPPTSKGLKVGDPASKAVQLYGASQPFNGALVGIESKGRVRRGFRFGPGGPEPTESTIDDPPEFKDALFFPAAKLLVAVAKDKVVKLAIVEEEDTLPDWLQPPEKAPPSPFVKIDPSLKVPKADPEKEGAFLVPPPPRLIEYKGSDFTAQVPLGWVLADDTWTHPDSVESVTVRATKNNREESLEAAVFATLLTSGVENQVPPLKRRPTSSFCRMLGATEGYCCVTLDKSGGNEGLPLRTYRLLLIKGERRYEILVTRTQHPQKEELPSGSKTTAFMGCPDGDALARGVMRSFRITR
jgi:hypothetical protein